MYGSMEQSTPAEAPALGPAELVAAAADKLCRGEHGRLPRERWCCPVPLTVRGSVDTDCCTGCGYGSCAPGYTYAGQIAFDKETLSSTYPDFFPYCNEINCGNTCCVPSDEWDGARAAAGD